MKSMYKLKYYFLIFLSSVITINLNAQINDVISKNPPMGWNSYNCFGATVTEDEVKANADMMEIYLKDFGWEYIVIDYCWYYPKPGALGNPSQTPGFIPGLAMDEFGRLLPAEDRFPSSSNGKGFKPIADYIHGKGLKFGIHIMRGIPRQAVANNTIVFNSEHHAKDIANKDDTCAWLNLMYGIDCSKNGAQEYYNSIINLYASWGIDYIKVDDMSKPYHKDEIEAIRKAIDQCNRPIVLSLSPGSTPIEYAEHVKKNANLWRISKDFWDNWDALKGQFANIELWAPHIEAGHWPDADMLPIGRLARRGPEEKMEHQTNFSEAEQYTLMTLWSIIRSPLMMGGDLTLIDHFTLKILTNREVLFVNQKSTKNRLLFHRGNHVAWVAEGPNSNNKYLAVFNTGEDEVTPVYVLLEDIGIQGKCQIRDLWDHKDLGSFNKDFVPLIPPHGAGLYKIY